MYLALSYKKLKHVLVCIFKHKLSSGEFDINT